MHRFIVVAIAALIASCSNTRGVINEATSTNDQPDCTTVVEIALRCDTMYYEKPPFLVLKQAGFGSRYLPGTIHSVADTGILFRPNGSSSSEPDFYSPGNVQCLVDSENTIVFGNWGDRSVFFWDIALLCKRIRPTPSDYITLVLQPNKTVSYCLNPGEYEVNYLVFRNSKNYADQSDSLNNCTFILKPNTINFLGTIQHAYKRYPSADMVSVPYRVIYRPEMGKSTPFYFGNMSILEAVVVGAMTGFVEGMAKREIAEQAKVDAPLHALRTLSDSSFSPASQQQLPVRFAPITFSW